MRWSELLCSERLRQYKKPAGSGDLRSEFEKDYHRIIQSASFRRLQDKTQVFPLDKSDFIRTRLTHSLEVSSYCKSLGQNICRSILSDIKDKSFDPRFESDVCEILECAGLIHDIGNPPFGHFGETIIRTWFKQNIDKFEYKGKSVSQWLTEEQLEDFFNFEGNTQALRLVTKLHYLVDEHGMNLTKGLLGTIIKYPVSSTEIDKKAGDIRTKKMGYFAAEKAEFDSIQNSLGTNGKRHPLTYVLEAADDIAYATADIEDAYKKGFISYRELKGELRKGLEGEKNCFLEDMIAYLEKKLEKAESRNEVSCEQYAVQNWMPVLQGGLIKGATRAFIQNYDAIMKGEYTRDLLSSCEEGRVADILKDIAFRYAFQSRHILQMEIAAERIISFFLDKMIPAIINYDEPDCSINEIDKKYISLISENYKTIYKFYSKNCDEGTRLYLRFLLVTDYVCGMTDSFARDMYRELNGIS